MKKEINKEIEKLKSDVDKTRTFIEMFAEITGDKSAEFKLKTMDLQDLVNNIAINSRNVNDGQYEELMNCVDQFIKVIEKYLKEKGIKLEKKF